MADILVALTSDIHIGSMVQQSTILKRLRQIKEFSPAVYLNLGDDNGGWLGYKASRTVSRMERNILGPDVVIAKCPGNHDYWIHAGALPYKSNGHVRSYGTRPPEDVWLKAIETIYTNYKELNIHSFNTEGPLRHGGWTFAGHSFWYEGTVLPETYDFEYLPYAWDGDTHRNIYRQSYNKFWDNIDKLTPADKNVVIVTHFPLVGTRFTASANGGQTLVNETSSMAEALMENHPVRAFFNGHMHEKHLGPLRYEAGSNQKVDDGRSIRYDGPRFLILRLSDDGSIEVVHHCK